MRVDRLGVRRHAPNGRVSPPHGHNVVDAAASRVFTSCTLLVVATVESPMPPTFFDAAPGASISLGMFPGVLVQSGLGLNMRPSSLAGGRGC